MTMQILNLKQGEPAWHAHRATALNASDAPAMMGCSSYKSRSDLVRERATGITPEVDAATQRRFDDGHLFEELARPLAEKIIGEELSPCVGTDGTYSASFDGLTFMGDTVFEHKTLGQRLSYTPWDQGNGDHLPLQYRVQMEQQLMVSGAERVLFMASRWAIDPASGKYALEAERHCWYVSDPELRAQIIAGWQQFQQDVAAYDASAPQPAPVVAEPVESLPAVVIQVNGALTIGGNLVAFGDALRAFVANLAKEPSTDQEFANAEAACKTLKKAEDALDAGEDAALSSISPVEEMRRLKADLKNFARTNRLAQEKLVAAKKDSLRNGLVASSQQNLDQHVAALNQRLGAQWIGRIAGGFQEVIKGLKSLDSMRDKVAVTLTNAKHEANQLAARLETNRKHLVQDGTDWIALFADFAAVGTKAAEDFQALAALRIGQHKQAEAQRLEAERARIRAEEEAKAKREAEAKASAEAAEQTRQLEVERERIRAEEQAKARAEAAARRQQVQQQAQEAQADIAQATQDGTLAKPLADDLSGLVAEQAAEGLASIDAQQAIGAAKVSAAVAPAAADDGPIMTLGQINTKLEAAGLGKISAATLEFHGIPFAKERGAVQIKTTQVRRLLLLISMGARKFADELQAAAV